LHRLVSHWFDPDFARKTLLVPAMTATREPSVGRVWHDAAARPSFSRDVRPCIISFADLYAWHIPDALVTDQFLVHDARNLYCDSSIMVSGASAEKVGQACQNLANRFSAIPPRPVVEDHADELALVLHNEGGGTWGHYLVQMFPKVLLFCERFPKGKVIVPETYAAGNSSFSQLFDLYGISRDRLIGVDGDKTYRIGEAILLDFPFDFAHGAIHPAALDLLDRFEHAMAPAVTPQGAYVRRLPHAARATVNQEQVAAELATVGIPAMTMGDRSVQDQAAMWHDHGLIVGTLGSDLANIVFARPGSRVLVLSPDWFGDTFFYNLATARGIHWHEIRCGRMGERVEPERHSSFNVDIGSLRTVLASLA